MNEFLIKLKEQLLAIVEEIDNYSSPSGDLIFIKKEDFRWISHLGRLNSNIHIFEYKDGMKFLVSDNLTIYKNLMKGTLDEIILQKKENATEGSDGHLINYELEGFHHKTLRKLYKEPKADGSLD